MNAKMSEDHFVRRCLHRAVSCGGSRLMAIALWRECNEIFIVRKIEIESVLQCAEEATEKILWLGTGLLKGTTRASCSFISLAGFSL